MCGNTLWHLYCANSKTTARVTRRRRRKLIEIEEAHLDYRAGSLEIGEFDRIGYALTQEPPSAHTGSQPAHLSLTHISSHTHTKARLFLLPLPRPQEITNTAPTPGPYCKYCIDCTRVERTPVQPPIPGRYCQHKKTKQLPLRISYCCSLLLLLLPGHASEESSPHLLSWRVGPQKDEEEFVA